MIPLISLQTALRLVFIFLFLKNTSSTVNLREPRFPKARQYNQNYGAYRLKNYALNDTNKIRSYIVLQKGETVAEYYKDNLDETSRWPIWSCTKSWTSLLVGVMIDNGLLSLNETLGDIWPDEEVWSMVEDAEEKMNVTLESLITMSGGLYQIQDSPLVLPSGAEDFGLNAVLNDVYFSELDIGIWTYLGLHWTWSYIILERTGMEPNAYAEATVFPKLGIKSGSYKWHTNTYNVSGTAFGLEMTPTQMAKLGQLYLQGGLGGLNEDDYVVSADYIDDSAAVTVPYEGGVYGYMWMSIDGLGAQCASGAGGQWICFWKDQEIVLAVQTQGDLLVPSSTDILYLTAEGKFDEDSSAPRILSKIILCVGGFIALLTAF